MTYINYGSVTAIGVLFPTLGLVALAIRFYGRAKYALSVEIDDLLALVAAVLDIAGGVGMIYGAQRKLVGGHTVQTYQQYVETSAERQVELEKLEYAFWVYHAIAIGTVKLTLLFFFRRVFRSRMGWTAFDFANWFLIGFTIVCMFLFMFLDVFMCRTNFYAAWGTIYELKHDCMNTFEILMSTAIVNFTLDLAIFLEPLVMISKLHMDFMRKVQTSLIFAISLFAVVAGLLRMIVFIQLVLDRKRPAQEDVVYLGEVFARSDDEGVVSTLLFWTYMEIGVGFLVACLPPCGRVIDDTTAPMRAKLKSLSSLMSNYASSGYSKSASLSADQSKSAASGEKPDFRETQTSDIPEDA